MSGNYELVLPFLTDDPKWVHGFECGILYQRMVEEEKPIIATIHAINDEQVRVMCGHLGWLCEIEPMGDGWARLTLERKQ
jgi:hypothetical protein